MQKRGFTLLELIIVVAIIALLAASAFVAVNPAKRIGNAQNAKRWADVTSLADAWSHYMGDNNGVVPVTSADCITANTACMIANYAGTDLDYACAATTTHALISLDSLVTNGYVGQIPNDPKSSSLAATSTGYYFAYDSLGKLTIGACETYNSQTIKLIR